MDVRDIRYEDENWFNLILVSLTASVHDVLSSLGSTARGDIWPTECKLSSQWTCRSTVVVIVIAIVIVVVVVIVIQFNSIHVY
jgi:hypothetical protein